MNLPPSILNNPNIPPEVISNLQAGRLGSTIFVANLDFKVGWKKLKEVFSIAGTVKRADIKEDKDGKSRGMGTSAARGRRTSRRSGTMELGVQPRRRRRHRGLF